MSKIAVIIMMLVMLTLDRERERERERERDCRLALDRCYWSMEHRMLQGRKHFV